MSQERRLTFAGRRAGASFKSCSNMLLGECSNTELRRATIWGSVEICRVLYGYVGRVGLAKRCIAVLRRTEPCMAVHSHPQPYIAVHSPT